MATISPWCYHTGATASKRRAEVSLARNWYNRKVLARGSQSGVTLVEAMIALGIIAMLMMIYVESEVKTRQAARRVSASENFMDVDSLVKGELRYFLSRITAAGNCVDYPTVFASRTILSQGGTVPITFETNLGRSGLFGGSGLDATQINAANALLQTDTSAGGAFARCTQPVRPKNAITDSENSFFFCLNFQRDPSAARGSFMASPRAFAEIAVELVSFRTSTPISCQKYVAAPSGGAGSIVGANIHATLYCMVGGNDSFYKNHAMSFFLAKP